MSKCCVCYIANAGYLFPTLVSATQAVRHVSPGTADVMIVDIGAPTPESSAISKACEREGIRFLQVDPAAIGHMSIYFARLLVDRFLPPEYTQVLYLDGDTQVVGSLDPLIDINVKPGKVVASRDPLALLADRDGADADKARRRWTDIGLQPRNFKNYINSGVLRFNREGWAEIGEQCMSHYQSDPKLYAFPDQDVLNVFARDNLQIESFAWNFPGFFLVHKLDAVVAPRIVHFMSNPRPWHGPLPAFKKEWYKPYLDMVARHPTLLPYWPKLPKAKYVRYILQQHFVRIRNEPTWGARKMKLDLACMETASRIDEVGSPIVRAAA